MDRHATMVAAAGIAIIIISSVPRVGNIGMPLRRHALPSKSGLSRQH
jgi:hypothetical protein